MTIKHAVKTLVPDSVYTNRQEFTDYFYDYALEASERRAMSTVLLGKRRMGKTEIFKRVVNRLFFEQDHTDPKAVVPVFFSFPDEVISRRDFALKYVENFMRWYVAFRLHKPEILSEDFTRSELLEIAANVPSAKFPKSAVGLLRGIEKDDVTLPEEKALILPRIISDWDDSTIVMFLDEFQNTHLPQYNFRVVGFMQEAVESPTCPHFVTGSAMSILAKEILGRGALFGRFRSNPIEPMTEYWGTELARRASVHYRANITNLTAPLISRRCGGNPFYITALIQQAAEQGIPLADEETVNRMLAVDLSSGFIWAELNDQVTRWIQRTNEHGITKWVLYLSALEQGEKIKPERIKQHLSEKEDTHVSLETIRDVLIRLSRGDLLEYAEIGGWFRKTDDPILEDFLKVWGKFEVEGHKQSELVRDTIKQYSRLKRQVDDQKGYLAEIYLSQILWNGQRRTFPGSCFHTETDVKFPDNFYDIRQRLRLGASSDSEADVYAFADDTIWLCESKWWETQKVGPKVVRDFLKLAEKLKDYEGREYFEGERPFALRLWLFAYSGVTKEAESLLKEHGIYWSDRSDLDWLIQETGLRQLPEFVK
ncbi:MAG: hypothetical protein GY749_12055 [Desulfobacteraceae bacterium]|nr:hypothetical protein [Desulfobacteraceae bacterium]